LGRNGIQEIMGHPFFKGLDWKNLRSMIPPYKPPVKNANNKRTITMLILMSSRR